MVLRSFMTGLSAIMIYNLKFSAQVVELVDTRDLKSLEGDFVPVQVRPWVQSRNIKNYFENFSC